MKSNKTPSTLSGMTTRQKVVAVIFVLVLIFLIWEVYGLMGGGSSSVPKTKISTAKNAPHAKFAAAEMTPQHEHLIKPPPAPLNQRELQLLQLQQETEAKYVSTVNQLQLLKLSRDIAETNQAIMNAKLATITSEKKIIDMLKPPPPPPPPPPTTYTHGLVNPTPVSVTTHVEHAPATPELEVNYSVVSVTELHGRWSAVIGYQGNLYHIAVGDILPPDDSRVVHIDRTGVILEKSGVKKKFSLVSII